MVSAKKTKWNKKNWRQRNEAQFIRNLELITNVSGSFGYVILYLNRVIRTSMSIGRNSMCDPVLNNCLFLCGCTFRTEFYIFVAVPFLRVCCERGRDSSALGSRAKRYFFFRSVWNGVDDAYSVHFHALITSIEMLRVTGDVCFLAFFLGALMLAEQKLSVRCLHSHQTLWGMKWTLEKFTFVAFSPSVGPLTHKWSNKIYISFGDSTQTNEHRRTR